MPAQTIQRTGRPRPSSAPRAERGSPPLVECALSWSGGKDSALTLWTLRLQGVEPEALITTVTDAYDRISMHGVRRELLRRQADVVGIPLVEVRIPAACVNDVYEARMTEAFASAPLSSVEAVAFGDLFLEDVRAYRETRLSATGRRGLFPLWGRDTGALAREFIAAGFQAFIVCLDPRVLDASFAGRAYDEQLLADLPASVDPCGENGEFHTFVHGGPIFSEPIACETGEVVQRDGFVFCDLTPA
ncbi:MAG TPA: ATP-binding protein [Solirubrobacteraceae bacterium]